MLFGRRHPFETAGDFLGLVQAISAPSPTSRLRSVGVSAMLSVRVVRQSISSPADLFADQNLIERDLSSFRASIT